MKRRTIQWWTKFACVALSVSLLGLAGLPAQAQGRYEEARSLVMRTQEDLKRAEGFIREKKDERERVENALRRLSDFDRSLSKNKFDKDRLNEAIEDLKNLIDHNTLSVEDRDALRQDLQDLRALRARYD